MDANSPTSQYASLAAHCASAFALPVARALPEQPAAVTAPWCLTVLAADIETAQLEQLAAFVSADQWRPVALDILAARADCKVVRIQLEGDIAFAAARLALLELGQSLGVELVLQAGETQRAPKLACFDMDSTLIQAEVIDELAKIAGVGDQVAEITLSAMRGELDFQQSFRKRMGLLKGFTEASLAEIAPRIPIMPGAQRLLLALRALGCKSAILSGGFTYFANYLRDNHLAVDFVHANQLEFDGGALTGNVIDPIVDGARKALLLQEIAKALDLSLDQVIAVGDGANDLPMLSLGALGIAFHAKPKVRAEAPQAIDGFGLDAALYLFGLNDRAIAALLDERT
ncbi:phosphoserine phosphatase SerB [Microbulbifer elongatus]|uniref:Phosphoserine phosphatase n=1 Tax=Microbulbifer elongatus TaxID=86173 RepID=A0ABT1P1P3_9GAMM|nr:phosphoserine phosphatase SerB [Microbulbifer elongatus]MCQ3829039.1 phosphoserine phosphatase SerB [Microbulbifer elongatus]